MPKTRVTLRENRAAFERVRLPRVLVDVSKVDTALERFGKRAALLLAIAPTGGISAGRYGAELILARAAKAVGVPFTMATPSAFSIEKVAEEVGGRLWFQLYAVRDREFGARLVNRAKAQVRSDPRHRRPSRVGQARTRSAQRLSHAVQPELAQFEGCGLQAGLGARHDEERPSRHGEPRGLPL